MNLRDSGVFVDRAPAPRGRGVRRRARAAVLAATFALVGVAGSAAGCGSPDESDGGAGGSGGSEQRSAGQQDPGQGGGSGGAGGSGDEPANRSANRPDLEPPKTAKQPPEEFSDEGFRVPSEAEGKLSDVRVGRGTAGGGDSEDAGGSGGDGGDSGGGQGDQGDQGEQGDANQGSGDQSDGEGAPVETVTFDLGTEKLPEYQVRYVDAVRAHPAEQPIDIAGDAYLEVGFELTDPNENGRLAIPPNSRPDQPLIKETLLVRNVGGEIRFAVGLAEKASFRARQEGSSLVIELRTG